MEVVDIVVVVVYFLLVLAIGFMSMLKSNRTTVSGYFLAGRSMCWAAVGASLFVSNIGSEHFIGLAGSGAASGLAVAAWELNSLLLLQFLSWVFIPVYIQSGVYTMPQYLSRRYGGRRLKVYFAGLSLLLYLFTKLSVDLYAGALFIQESLGWNLYASIILLIAMTALLTVTGGLVAVIYTDVIQAFLMISGALCLTVISLSKVGGMEELKTRYMQASPNITAILLYSPNLTYVESCHSHLKPKSDALKILRGPTDPDLPWPGFILGQTPASIWYWCADQVLVQRVLAAKNLAHAKGSTIMAGFLKILPMFIIVIPGMISRIFFTDELACISPKHCVEVCGSEAGCSNIAYPRLVMSVMPPGLRGLMMAVMIAALMSDLDSIFNSASTIFTLDIYKMLRKHATSNELLIVGRYFVIFMVIVSIAWVPVVIEMQGGQMFLYIQEVSDYLTPPIAALFLLGILWHRCNEIGAFCGGMVGFTLGSLRLMMAFVYREPRCDQPDKRPGFIKHFHFMYMAAFLFWITVLVTVAVSLCTPPPDKDLIMTTTLWGLKQMKRQTKQQTTETDGTIHSLTSLNDSTLRKNIKDKPNSNANQYNAHYGCATVDTEKVIHVGVNSGQSLKGSICPCKHDVEIEERLGEQEGQWCFDGAQMVGQKYVRSRECFCGFQRRPFKSVGPSVLEDIDVDTLLHEAPQTAIILNTGLALICSTGVFLFIYFSL